MIHGSIAPRQSQPPVGAGLANMPITATENFHPKPAPPRHPRYRSPHAIAATRRGGFSKHAHNRNRKSSSKTRPHAPSQVQIPTCDRSHL
ncbi:MAG: hypothetical protein ACRCZS_23025 [Chroococcidiopsis sp.]